MKKPGKMKKITSLLLLLSCCVFPALSQTVVTAQSPDKKLSVDISLTSGTPGYTLKYNGIFFIENSPLGLVSSIGDFTKQLQFVDARTNHIKDTYTLDRSKVSKVNYDANELVCTFINVNQDTLHVVFRVSNQDVAFQYKIPGNGKTGAACNITKEATGFKLPAHTTTFITPQALAMTGYEESKPSYEERYTIEEPTGTKSLYGQGYTFPALFHIGGKDWLLLSETGNKGDYPGTHLSDAGSDSMYSIAFPQPGENNGKGSADADSKLPMETSWKTVTIGETLKPIVESTVATDVVTPVISSSKVFKPGRSSWSWLIWQDESCNYDDQVTYINLAADLKCEYILIDAYWDTRIGKEKMKELAQYAKSKNVEILLWYNSNGNWNNAPQTPKNAMDTHNARVKEMEWLQSIGVKGIKVDFFGGDKQVTMQLYHDILVDAANYGLFVDFHGTTLPRGWERMYPNFMSSEAVLSSENLVFRQSFDDDYASIATTYPFTRNAVAAFDFSPVMLNKRLARRQDQGTIRRTTDAFEIATSVIFFSALQNWGLTPDNLKDKPGYVFDFIKEVPTVWDETRYIDGYPGKYCALARRKGDRWYIGVINGENTIKKVTLSLPMFRNTNVIAIKDGQGQESVSEKLHIGKKTTIALTLSPNGGAVFYSDK